MSVEMHRLIISVNGRDVKVSANDAAPVGDIIPIALSEAKVTGEPNEWVLKSESGQEFDSFLLLSSFGLPTEAVLYLTRRKAPEAGA